MIHIFFLLIIGLGSQISLLAMEVVPTNNNRVIATTNGAYFTLTEKIDMGYGTASVLPGFQQLHSNKEILSTKPFAGFFDAIKSVAADNATVAVGHIRYNNKGSSNLSVWNSNKKDLPQDLLVNFDVTKENIAIDHLAFGKVPYVLEVNKQNTVNVLFAARKLTPDKIAVINFLKYPAVNKGYLNDEVADIKYLELQDVPQQSQLAALQSYTFTDKSYLVPVFTKNHVQFYTVMGTENKRKVPLLVEAVITSVKQFMTYTGKEVSSEKYNKEAQNEANHYFTYSAQRVNSLQLRIKGDTSCNEKLPINLERIARNKVLIWNASNVANGVFNLEKQTFKNVSTLFPLKTLFTPLALVSYTAAVGSNGRKEQLLVGTEKDQDGNLVVKQYCASGKDKESAIIIPHGIVKNSICKDIVVCNNNICLVTPQGVWSALPTDRVFVQNTMNDWPIDIETITSVQVSEPVNGINQHLVIEYVDTSNAKKVYVAQPKYDLLTLTGQLSNENNAQVNQLTQENLQIKQEIIEQKVLIDKQTTNLTITQKQIEGYNEKLDNNQVIISKLEQKNKTITKELEVKVIALQSKENKLNELESVLENIKKEILNDKKKKSWRSFFSFPWFGVGSLFGGLFTFGGLFVASRVPGFESSSFLSSLVSWWPFGRTGVN